MKIRMFKEKLIGNLNSVQEYERVPVPKSKWRGWSGFIGLYAAEHIAGTEFVIGPLFVAHGVNTQDLVWGLLLGNLLAVLSWTFICAPIATKFRLTLYFLVEKICGVRLAFVYNIVNALGFCFLAGAMTTVSATAVAIPFHLQMPSLNDWFPTNIGWVIIVVLIGLVTTLVAMFGYSQICKLSNIVVPWIMLVFVAAAFNVLPQLGVNSFSDFPVIANSKIWIGQPIEGQSLFTFWHVMFFAWFVNIAMHIGMADLSILRYAKKWYHGFSTATGMYIGHFIAWMSSGILYALFLQESQYSTEFAPGPVAFRAVGLVGILAVLFAGLTTANPTIYRAGLALQAVMPKWKTWKVTMLVGLVTIVFAVFPGIVMKFLEFIALYGLILMPMGAIILMDVLILPKIKLESNFAEYFKKTLNPSGLVAWLLSLIICFFLNYYYSIEIFFLGLPGWIIACLLYVSVSFLTQKLSVFKNRDLTPESKELHETTS